MYRLRVFVQLNTSGEEAKSGVDNDSEAHALARHVVDKCSMLHFVGFMTIGALEHSIDGAFVVLGEIAFHSSFALIATASGKNPDFTRLHKCAQAYCAKHGVDFNDVELSMGMSHDFELAVEQVTYGSAYFGASYAA